GRGPEGLAALSPAVDTLALALGPTHRMTLAARVHRALALAEVGRSEEARDEVRALDALPEAHHETLPFDWVAGRIARLGGRPDEAVAWQGRALEHLPADPPRQWYLMRILVEMGLSEVDLDLRERARKALLDGLALAGTQLREEGPVQAEAWVGLGRVLLLEGRSSEALEPLRKADAFWQGFDAENPERADASLALGKALNTLGRRVEARAAFERATRLRALAHRAQ